jgi:hypothetical protein
LRTDADSPVTAACTAQKLLLNACEIVVYGENHRPHLPPLTLIGFACLLHLSKDLNKQIMDKWDRCFPPFNWPFVEKFLPLELILSSLRYSSCTLSLINNLFSRQLRFRIQQQRSLFFAIFALTCARDSYARMPRIIFYYAQGHRRTVGAR